MRVALAGLAAGVVACCIAASSTAASAPRLELAGTDPLVVLGSHFGRGERITLTAVTLLGPKRVSTKATRSGAFRATFRLYDQPCGRAVMVFARGTTGSRATLRLASEPCVPPPIE